MGLLASYKALSFCFPSVQLLPLNLAAEIPRFDKFRGFCSCDKSGKLSDAHSSLPMYFVNQFTLRKGDQSGCRILL